MLHQNTDNINTSNEINISFISAIKELKVSKILNTCGIRKLARRIDGEASAEKRTAFEIFQFLLIMVFQGCNLHRFLGSKKQDIACSKSTYHRFLNYFIVCPFAFGECLEQILVQDRFFFIQNLAELGQCGIICFLL